MHKRFSGFTIVELLVVIVVIGILASITVVAYNGIQERARDTKRKSDVAQIVKLLATYEAQNGPMHTGSGCGQNGDGSGYFNAQNGTSYQKSIMQCLIDANITNTVIADENTTGCDGKHCHTYMKYSCEQDGQVITYVYANLEGEGHTGADTDGTCNEAIDGIYGMNYYVRVN